ncbi:hypothetical protein PNOK_0578000 [Pyrrhoderma noxium]|uniref:Uncharacterized protein n=1 Tax=Pyrrhoderma noxium TaxID=2282107 RepID=A0A286UH76_9AGAM|nr:hypothetical protein PNOK_0578000 [Pyrrhoderma noxium]
MSSSSNDRDPINTPAKYKEVLNCLVDEIWHPPSPNDKTARTAWSNRQQTRLMKIHFPEDMKRNLIPKPFEDIDEFLIDSARLVSLAGYPEFYDKWPKHLGELIRRSWQSGKTYQKMARLAPKHSDMTPSIISEDDDSDDSEEFPNTLRNITPENLSDSDDMLVDDPDDNTTDESDEETEEVTSPDSSSQRQSGKKPYKQSTKVFDCVLVPSPRGMLYSKGPSKENKTHNFKLANPKDYRKGDCQRIPPCKECGRRGLDCFSPSSEPIRCRRCTRTRSGYVYCCYAKTRILSQTASGNTNETPNTADNAATVSCPPRILNTRPDPAKLSTVRARTRHSLGSSRHLSRRSVSLSEQTTRRRLRLLRKRPKSSIRPTIPVRSKTPGKSLDKAQNTASRPVSLSNRLPSPPPPVPESFGPSPPEIISLLSSPLSEPPRSPIQDLSILSPLAPDQILVDISETQVLPTVVPPVHPDLAEFLQYTPHQHISHPIEDPVPTSTGFEIDYKISGSKESSRRSPASAVRPPSIATNSLSDPAPRIHSNSLPSRGSGSQAEISPPHDQQQSKDWLQKFDILSKNLDNLTTSHAAVTAQAGTNYLDLHKKLADHARQIEELKNTMQAILKALYPAISNILVHHKPHSLISLPPPSPF